MLLPSRSKLEETVTCLKSLEEEKPTRSSDFEEETSEIQIDASGQDYDKLKKVACEEKRR